MNVDVVVLAVALLLNFLYFGIALFAFYHVRPEKKDKRGVNRLFALTLWWPFYADLYDDSAARATGYGKLLLIVIAGLYVLYAVLTAR